MPMCSITSSNDVAITLADVKKQFSHWRKTRRKPSKIPEELWDGVKQLTKQYRCNQIAKELRLNLTQIRSRLQKERVDHQKGKGSDALAMAEFVIAELPSEVACNAISQFRTLELSRPDGIVLRVIGLDHQETYALVERFLG